MANIVITAREAERGGFSECFAWREKRKEKILYPQLAASRQTTNPEMGKNIFFLYDPLPRRPFLFLPASPHPRPGVFSGTRGSSELPHVPQTFAFLEVFLNM